MIWIMAAIYILLFGIGVTQCTQIRNQDKQIRILMKKFESQDRKLESLIKNDGQRKLSMELIHQKLNDLPDKNAKICRDETAKNFYYILTGMERR